MPHRETVPVITSEPASPADPVARAVLDSLGDGICTIDEQGRFTFINPAASRMLGLSPEEACGQSMHALVHHRRGDDARFPVETCPICQALRSDQLSHIDHEVFWRPDGTSFPVEFSAYPLDPQYGSGAIVVRFTDITGRRISTQEMLYIMASAQCLLWYADVQYIRDKNKLRWFLWPADPKAARRFLPFEMKEGMTFAEAFYDCRLEEDKDGSNTLGLQEIMAGRSYRQEYRCRLENGDVRWIAEEVQVEKVAEGRWRAVGVCTDITEAKEREREIEHLNERLRRAMAETHHRVKNNLQVIAALIDIQAHRSGETVPTSELERLEQHVRALATIHDLLTQEAKAGREVDYVSVQETMQKMMPLLQGMVGSRSLTYRADDIKLPIRQATSLAVLMNELVANAVKHGEGGITLALTGVDDRAQLEVCDEGSGFAPGFDPESAAHTGLELITSLGRWDLQGEVRFDNQPDSGARVTVDFPLPAGPDKA